MVRGKHFIICESGILKSVDSPNVEHQKKINLTLDNYSIVYDSINYKSSNINPEIIFLSKYISQYENELSITTNSSRHTDLLKALAIMKGKLNCHKASTDLSLLNSNQLEPNIEQYFHYMPNPKVFVASQLYTIRTGNTSVIFTGEYFNSVHCPYLTIDVSAKQNDNTNMLYVDCLTDTGENSLLKCLLPSFEDYSDIESANAHLHLDGLVKQYQIKIFPDPKFDTLEESVAYTVSLNDKQLILTGKNLLPDLPYNILIDNEYSCIVYKSYGRELHCKVNATDEILQEFVDSQVNLSVDIGSKFLL